MKPMMIEATRLDIVPIEAATVSVFGSTAVIPVIGYLSKAPAVFNLFSTTYEEITDAILAALDNPKIERIVLDINSPGGDVSGLFELCELIREASNEKPIEAIANDDAFSAAYAIASSARNVWITKTGGVGSIGVIATHRDQSEYDKKRGVKITPIFAGNHKNDLSPHEPITEHALEMIQSEINRLYDLLVETVANNRGLSCEAVRNTQAALFFGERAVTAGLADGTATLKKLINQQGVRLTRAQQREEAGGAQQKVRAQCVFNTKRALSSTKGDVMEKENQIELGEAENEVAPELPSANSNTPEPAPPAAAAIDVMELVELSKIARRPELLGAWLEKGMTVAQAKEALLNEMEQNPEIITARMPLAAKPTENPLIQSAKARAKV